MQRKKLLALQINTAHLVPVMPCFEDVEYADLNGHKYSKKKYNYCYTAFVDSSTGENVLIIDVYKPALNAAPEFDYRLFLTKNKWFSVDANGKTSERSLFLYDNYTYYWSTHEYHQITDNDDKTISDFIGKNVKGKGLIQVSNFQNQIRERRLKEKYERIKESTSREMLEIKPLPKAFDSWLKNVVFKNYRYLFYLATKNKHTTAHCSHCGNVVKIDTPHKDEKARCPHCHSLCICKPRKAFDNTYGFKFEKRVVYIQPLQNNRFCYRTFNAVWSFEKPLGAGKYMPTQIIDETWRIFQEINYGYINNTSLFYADPNYKGGEWRQEYHPYGEATSTAYIYPSTLNKIFKSVEGFNKWHIDFNKIARKCGLLSENGLWQRSNDCAFLMNLVDNGLTNLAQDIINCGNYYYSLSEKEEIFDFEKGSLRKGCGISKDDLPMFKKLNPNFNEFKLLLKYKQFKRPIRIDVITEVFEIANKAYWTQTEKVLTTVAKWASWESFVKYFNQQEFIKEKIGPWRNPVSDFMSDYKDYLGWAELLEYDMKDRHILFPRNLKKAHDETYKIINDDEFKKGELPQIARQFKKYDRLYSFEYGDFILKPPTRHQEIKTEGKSLRHCVASYAERVAKGETIILFIRKKDEPDTPYFTLNLDPVTYAIIQCRGLRNCSYPPEVKRFMDKWYAEKVEPLKGEKKCQKTA